MSIGRNDPCPCGSGKKYKKCHGVQDSFAAAPRAEVARANALRTVDGDLRERLLRFARMRRGAEWLDDAFDAFDSYGTFQVVEDAELERLAAPLSLPWALHFMPIPPAGLALAELWRREQTRRLTPDMRLLLDAYAASWLSIWEVASVERGVGSALVDTLTGEQRFVHDVSSSETLEPFDSLLGFVLTCDGVSFFGGAHGQPLPLREADAVAREARRLCRVRTRPVAIDKLRISPIQLAIVALWNAGVWRLRTQPPPVMQNTDGDPFVLTTDDFELLVPRDRVARRLRSLEGAMEPEADRHDIVFVVTKEGNARHSQWDNTIIGRIVLGTKRLRVETNSARRADALRARVEAHVGGMARFRLRTEANTADLLEQARASASSSKVPARDAPPPEAVAMLREFRERHMAAWLDTSIPALDGLTPCAAARSSRIRPKLKLLVKEFERGEAHLPPEERIDLSRFWLALDLDRPDPPSKPR